jgi:hypothetical protein
MIIRLVSALSVVLLCSAFLLFHSTAQVSTPLTQTPDSLNLDQGYLEGASSLLRLKLVKSSQTAAALTLNSDKSFDFTPGDRLAKRAANGFHHLGDLTFRLRREDSTHWTD